MAKPNYQYEKRQRELAKKAKKAEKAARKSTGQPGDDEADPSDTSADNATEMQPADGQAGAEPGTSSGNP